MQRIVTLPERKAAETARRHLAVKALLPELAAYARAHGGRFLLYGSAARGTMSTDGDVDLLLDFPPEAQNDAWGFAERACWAMGWSRISCRSADARRRSSSILRLT